MWGTLNELGLRIQLGHSPESQCFNPRPAIWNFTVIHTNGLHHVTLDFCECDHSTEARTQVEQLLWAQWYPTTHLSPGTCATFTVLEMFSIMNLQGKLSGFDFYGALDKLTNNTGLGMIKVGLFPNFLASDTFLSLFRTAMSNSCILFTNGCFSRWSSERAVLIMSRESRAPCLGNSL